MVFLNVDGPISGIDLKFSRCAIEYSVRKPKKTCSKHLEVAARECGTYLSVFLQDGSKEAECIWKALGTSTFPHADHSCLFWVQHSAL